MEIRLIAFDLDGTLLREDKSISRANLAALEKAARMGSFFALVYCKAYFSL